jgi:GT2 family glycosyltransferase
VNLAVILPTYRRATYPERALPTILGQTLADFELIVMDDGSPDDTADVVPALCRSRRHLRQGEPPRDASDSERWSRAQSR